MLFRRTLINTPGDACRGADGYEYIDNAICNGVAKESDDPYVGDDNDKCKEVPRAKSGVVGYTFVPGNIADVTRARSHNGGLSGVCVCMRVGLALLLFLLLRCFCGR
jgi:hypothetical protein